MLGAGNNPPNFGFTITNKKTGSLAALSRFASHQDAALNIERLGGGRAEVRMDKPFPVGNNRVNCTMPTACGRWLWLGAPFTVTD